MTRNIIAIILLAAAGAIFIMYTKPAYDSAQTLAAQSAQYDAALSKATQLQEVNQSLLSKYNSFDPNAINRLTTMLPNQVDNIRLILDLDNLAGQYGMALQNVNISTPSSQSGGVQGAIANASQPYDSLTLQFTTHGTYNQFMQFITALESSLRLVDLVTLDVSGGGSTGSSTSGPPQYTYAMTLQTYWLSQ